MIWLVGPGTGKPAWRQLRDELRTGGAAPDAHLDRKGKPGLNPGSHEAQLRKKEIVIDVKALGKSMLEIEV
jgi:hypothetical protein